MSLLGKRLLQNAVVTEEKQRADWCSLVKDYLEESSLEDWVLNEGKVNVIMQSPTFSGIVICWTRDLERQNLPRGTCTVVVKGTVLGNGEPINDSHETDREIQFTGKDGSVSVHVFRTEDKLYLPEEKVVICSETLSITDAERGRLLSKMCEHRCQSQPQEEDNTLPKHYTNFRDLIETLHHEIEPLEPGCNHSEEHIEKISQLLQTVRLDPSEVARYARFSKGHYTRNLVGYDVAMDGTTHKPKFTVLLLCWSNGQMSPIHNHAGSSCWVKVLSGQIREIRYDDSVSPPSVKRDLTLSANGVCYINDTQGLHAMGNADENSCAVSLHIYSPPYTVCSLFDPITFQKRMASMSAARTPDNPFAFVPVSQQKDGDTPINLGSFYALVSNALKAKDDHKVSSLVDRLVLQQNEWAEFVHFDPARYTRSLISLDSMFSLVLCSWNTSQSTPLHSHSSSTKCWVKVLSGSLQLKLFSGSRANPVLQKTLVFEEGAIVDHDLFTGLHILGNNSPEVPAVSLHLFTPPSVNMAYFDDSGMERIIPVVHSAHSATVAASRCCAADPIHACDRVIQKTRTGSFDDETKSEVSSVTEDAREEGKVEDLLSFFQQPQDSRIFTNISALIRFVSARNLTTYASEQVVMQSLNQMEVNPEEWRSLLGESTEVLIARGKTYSLSIARIDPHTRTARDAFPCATFIKVLEGELVLTQFLDSDLVHTGLVNPHGGAFVSNKLQCELTNAGESPCFTLYLTRDV